MKKFWIVLLSLGLVAAFALPAAAFEAKIAGSYFIQGIYENNRSLLADHVPGDGAVGYGGASMAYFGQRLRLEPVFKIAEGLNLNMRIDAMERVWGQEGVGSETTGADTEFAHLGTRNGTNEQNIQFRRVWVDFITPVGMFLAGYMGDGAWGTDAFDVPTEGPSIVYLIKLGPVIVAAVAEKAGEGRLGSVTYEVPAGFVDSDVDKYCLGANYLFPQGTFQLLYCRVNVDNLAYSDVKTYYNLYAAALKATFGPVYVEGEVEYQQGKYVWYQDPTADALHDYFDINDIDYKNLQYYVMAKWNIGPAWIGAQYAFSQGDDPNTKDKYEAVLVKGYGLWQPCLILFEDWTNRWAGNLGYARPQDQTFSNAVLYQIFAGWNPTPKITVKGSYTWAYADEKDVRVYSTNPYIGSYKVEMADDEYGQEFDITASIKIYDNLTYMVGFAYLWTGDYFKGEKDWDVEIDDDYLVINQLTLSF
jgi:hypothetical protein